MRKYLKVTWIYFAYFESRIVIPLWCFWLIPYWLINRSPVNTFSEIALRYVAANWENFLWISFVLLPVLCAFLAAFSVFWAKVREQSQQTIATADEK
jgi:hypothetical protein